MRSVAARLLNIPEGKVTIRPRPRIEIQSNMLYDVSANAQRLIIKEYLKPDEFDQAPVREFKALQLVSHLDLAPRPIAIHPHQGEEHPLVIYAFMEGDMWDRRVPSTVELGDLARTWINLNQLTTSKLWLSRDQEKSVEDIWQAIAQLFEKYEAWVESEFKAAEPALERCRQLLESCASVVSELSKLHYSLRFCRADTRFANVIRRPGGGLGLVDWEDSGLRDPAREIADLLTHPNQEDLLTPANLSLFLRTYLDFLGAHDDSIKERMDLYLKLFSVWWLGILLDLGLKKCESGHLSHWKIHGIRANDRLLRCLARGTSSLSCGKVAESSEAMLFFPV